TMSETCVCQICQKPKSPTDGQIAEVIRPSLLDCIKKHHPEWDGTGFVCFDDIGDCRKEYVKEVLQEEIGELSALDEEVVESLRQHEIVSSDIEKQFEKKLTFGERLSDRIAEFGGSWKFLISFGAVIFVWIVANTISSSRFSRSRSNYSKNSARNGKDNCLMARKLGER